MLNTGAEEATARNPRRKDRKGRAPKEVRFVPFATEGHAYTGEILRFHDRGEECPETGLS